MPLPVLLEPRHLFHCTRNSVSCFFFFPFSFSSGEEATEDNDSVLKESQTTTINHLGRSSKRTVLTLTPLPFSVLFSFMYAYFIK